jgi:hypothetical protein
VQPRVWGQAAVGIAGTVILGKSFQLPFLAPSDIIGKLPARVAATGVKWGTEGSFIGLAVFAVTLHVEAYQAAKSCSEATGYTPWILQ